MSLSKTIRQQFDELCQSRGIVVEDTLDEVIDALLCSIGSEVEILVDSENYKKYKKAKEC